MADALGIIGLIGVVVQILQTTAQFSSDWTNLPADSRGFIAELQALKTVLSETNTNLLISDDFRDAFEGRKSALLTQLGDTAEMTDMRKMVTKAADELENLLQDLRKRAQGHKFGWERLKGSLQTKRTRETVEILHRECQTLNSLMMVDVTMLTVATNKEVRETKATLQRWHEDEDAKNILAWLTAIDYTTKQRDVIARREPGTGQWLLDSTAYQNWIDGYKVTLFCPGIPGAGKTVVASIVVEDLYTRFQESADIGIAYIYGNFRRAEEQTARDLLSSLLKQLTKRRPFLPADVKSLHNRHKDGRPASLEGICHTLQSVVCEYGKVFIIVDALDELQATKGSRDMFLKELFVLQLKYNINILATSRHIADIAERFEKTVWYEIRAHADDIRRYIDGNVCRLPAFIRRNLALQEEVKTKIVEATDGMFLLAQLHLESFIGKRSPKALRSALAKLPSGSDAYDHAYSEVMERIESQLPEQRELALDALSWIVCAMRPLTTTELQHSLAVELDTKALDESNITDVEDIVSVCAGIVTVDQESSIIRLVHYTTQEYFMRHWRKWFPHAQARITDICATYLNYSVFSQGLCHSDEMFEARLRENPLYTYASQNWGHHAREAGGVQETCIRLLSNDNCVESQVQALMVNRIWTRRLNYSSEYQDKMKALHLVSYFGIVELAKYLLSSRSLLGCPKLVDEQDSYGQTPLSWAAERGYGCIVQLLLDTGLTEVDKKDVNGRTPLAWAARNGHEDVINILIAAGADASASDRNGCTPLSFAAAQGQKKVFELLLSSGAVVIDCSDLRGQSSIGIASEEGHSDVVEALLISGADFDAPDHSGLSPLSWAAQNNHVAVLKLLLSTGKVDVNRKNRSGRTPLSLAVEQGNEEIVKLLLDTGIVHADLADNMGYTPLSWAAVTGEVACLGLLLATRQVDIESKDRYGQTVLSRATLYKQENIVRILLEAKAGVDGRHMAMACKE